MLVEITIDCNGTIRFYNEHGIYHRVGGPAIEYANGSKQWVVNGARHRLDGPAVEYADGSKEWCINGKHYSEEGFNEIVGKL